MGKVKKTVFYDTHVSLGAKMAPFGGYVMPILYGGIVKEHFAARTKAALFDTCHMGEFRIEGKTACADLDAILSCAVSSLKIGQCRYGFICNPSGGVMDDQIVYRCADTVFFMVVNASTQDSDFAWISGHCCPSTTLTNLSEETAKIDLQGPASVAIARKLLEKPIDALTYYSFMYNRYKGAEMLISRTGFTGEIGFELYCDAKRAMSFWNESMELGALPAGLGARDTLRLEMGFPLYGHELDDRRNAAESGFSRAIARDKNFIGSEAVLDPLAVRQTLSGILLADNRAARRGDALFDPYNNAIGTVTSGSFAPSLGRAVALGYIKKDARAAGGPVMVRNDRHELHGVIAELPFYNYGTARRKLAEFL